MGRLFSFIGVDPERGRNRLRSGEHHIIGNGMRFDTTSDVILDERWRSILKSKELEAFDAIAGHLSRRLGYTQGPNVRRPYAFGEGTET